jgi:hypothetical protein
MLKVDFRSRARAHVKSAKNLMVENGESAARYAGLELRMAIEALTYQLLQVYLAEVPNSIMAQWTPKKILDELLEIDPNADKTTTIFVGIEETPGVPASKMEFLGEDRRFSVKWANKAHNALSNFLHEPTLAQLEKGVDVDAAARVKSEEILRELDRILDTPLFQTNFGIFVEIKCDCGFIIKRKEDVLKAGKPFSCGFCGRHYRYRRDEAEDRWTFAPSKEAYKCLSCDSEQEIETHLLASLPIIACSRCNAKTQVRSAFTLVPVAEGPLNKD